MTKLKWTNEGRGSFSANTPDPHLVAVVRSMGSTDQCRWALLRLPSEQEQQTLDENARIPAFVVSEGRNRSLRGARRMAERALEKYLEISARNNG